MTHNDKVSGQLLSHQANPEALTSTIRETRSGIIAAGEKPHVTIARQLEIIDRLAEFEFGRFLLQNRGMNGYWIHYALTYPWHKNADPPLSEIESFLIYQAPTVLASRQRLQHFIAENQKSVKHGARLGCVPCGMMGELLYLDYRGIDTIELIGIDLDPQALEQAQLFARERNLADHTKFILQDAWQLATERKFDLISCSGLTIYVPEDEKVTALFRRFYDALAADGVLVTSTLTPPLSSTGLCEWDMEKIDPEALLLQKIILADILNVGFQCYRTTEQTTHQLAAAGFKNIKIIYDDARVMPTLVAKK